MNTHRGAHSALRYLVSVLRQQNVRVVVGSVALAAVSAYAGFLYSDSRDHDAAGLLPFDSSVRKTGAPDTLYRVVVVAQRADCSGNLSHLAFLDRTAVAEHIAHRYVLVAGPAADTLGLRDLLPNSLKNATVSLLNSDQRELLQHLGHNATPMLALYDGRDRLLVISATPSDVYERTVFVRALTRILTNNPAP